MRNSFCAGIVIATERESRAFEKQWLYFGCDRLSKAQQVPDSAKHP